MESKEVSIGAPLAVAGVKLFPIIRTSINCWSRGRSLSGLGIKQPVGLVVMSKTATLGITVTGEPMDLERLAQEVPGLSVILQRRY